VGCILTPLRGFRAGIPGNPGNGAVSPLPKSDRIGCLHFRSSWRIGLAA
jgi:hypothetical protein